MHAGRWLIFFLLTSLSSFGQFKNVKIADVPLTDLPNVDVVINKRNPNNIIIASPLGTVYYSLDGGTTWQNVKLTSSFGLYGDPSLASDDKGNIFAFNLSDPTGEGSKNEKSLDQILCHISKDGGKTWEEGSHIGLNTPKDQRRPRATIDSKGNIWVVWTQFDKYKDADANCTSSILLTTSSSGKKWAKPFQISLTPGNCIDDDSTTTGAVSAVASDGKAFVAWANQGKIFLDRSFNGGGLWLTNDIAIGTQSGGSSMKIPGHDACTGAPVLMIDQSKSVQQGTMYISWADQRNGESNTDIWIMRSTNFGDNWSTPMRLGEDKNNRHQYLPSMTIDQSNGNVYVVYFDRGNYEDNQTDVYLAYSTDAGSNFKSVKISESPFVPGESSGLNASISAYRGIITPVWTRVDNGSVTVWTALIKEKDIIQPPATASKKKKKS